MTEPKHPYDHHDFNPETDAAAIEPYEEHPYYAELYDETGVLHPDWWFTHALANEAWEFEQEWGEAYRAAMAADEYHDTHRIEDLWNEARASPLGATEAEIAEFARTPIPDSLQQELMYSPEYWRATRDEALK